MTTRNAVERVTALSSVLAAAPVRIFNDLTTPARDELARAVRRSIGISEEPAPACMDPSESYLDPQGVARMVHADLPTMLIGGISALLLQTLHPLAMAGVAEHSNYQRDPLGRLRRTAAFVGTTTFGTTTEAEKAIAQVLRVHRRVTGFAPDGRAYSAGDPDLVTFVHVAEVASFLASARRFGPQVLTSAQCDQYYEEVAPVATALGATSIPRSSEAVAEYFRDLQPSLYAGPQSRQTRDWLRRGVSQRPDERAVYTLLLTAAISILPDWARRELGLAVPAPLEVLMDTVAIVPATRALSAGLRWMVRPQVAMDKPPSMATT